MPTGPTTRVISVPEHVNSGAEGAAFEEVWVPSDPDDTHANAAWVGCFVSHYAADGSTAQQGYIPVAGAAGGDQHNTIYGQVLEIRDSNMDPQSLQYVSTTDLDANVYYYRVLKATDKVVWRMSEDGDTTPIPAATSNVGINDDLTYADLIVTDPTDTSAAHNPYRNATGIARIDSSSVTITASNKPLRIKCLDPGIQNAPYAAAAGSKRNYLVRIQNAQQK